MSEQEMKGLVTCVANQYHCRRQDPAAKTIAPDNTQQWASSSCSRGCNASQCPVRLDGLNVSQPVLSSTELDGISETASIDGDSLILRTELSVARQKLVLLLCFCIV